MKQDGQGGGILLQSVTKSFGPQLVLNNVNFHLPAGDRLVISGPSGIGKTTLLRIVAGLELPDAGEMYIDNKLVTTNTWALEPNRRQMGFVFQTAALWPHMTVRSNIMFGLKTLPKKDAADLVDSMLAAAGIANSAGKYPDQLSGGEAKRVALIRSLAPKPRFLLLDEPFANLDTITKNSLLDYVLKITESNQITLIYITHDAAEISRIGGKILTF